MGRQRSRYELEQRVRELERFKLFVPNRHHARSEKAYTPESLQETFDAYFDACPNEQLTITGLALCIGSRQLLYDYEKRPEYSHIIKEARLRIENAYELNLRRFGRSGDQFALKQFGWKDDREVIVSKEGQSQITINVQLVQATKELSGAQEQIVDVECRQVDHPQKEEACPESSAEIEAKSTEKPPDSECEG